MAFLPVIMHVVTQLADVRLGELFVGDFGFLQADDIGLVLLNQRFELARSLRLRKYLNEKSAARSPNISPNSLE